MKVTLLIIGSLFLLHAVRDYLQIKYGYDMWFTRIGHFWHAPQYEKHSIVIFTIFGLLLMGSAIALKK